MIGDKIIIQAEHKRKAEIISNKFIELYKKRKNYIITIGGEAGTGKTETATILRELLYFKHIKAELIHIDDYYKTYWSERNKVRKETNVIGKKEIDWDKLNGVINTFHSDFHNSLIIQRINKFTNSIEKAILVRKNIDVLIVEGLYALYIKNSDLNIYLNGTYKDTKTFRLLRKKETQNPFRTKVLKIEHRDVTKSKKYANLVL